MIYNDKDEDFNEYIEKCVIEVADDGEVYLFNYDKYKSIVGIKQKDYIAAKNGDELEEWNIYEVIVGPGSDDFIAEIKNELDA